MSPDRLLLTLFTSMTQEELVVDSVPPILDVATLMVVPPPLLLLLQVDMGSPKPLVFRSSSLIMLPSGLDGWKGLPSRLLAMSSSLAMLPPGPTCFKLFLQLLIHTSLTDWAV